MFWDRICPTFQCYTVLEGQRKRMYIANVRDALLQPRPHPHALFVGAMAAHPHPLSSAIRHYRSIKTKRECPFDYLSCMGTGGRTGGSYKGLGGTSKFEITWWRKTRNTQDFASARPRAQHQAILLIHLYSSAHSKCYSRPIQDSKFEGWLHREGELFSNEPYPAVPNAPTILKNYLG